MYTQLDLSQVNASLESSQSSTGITRRTLHALNLAVAKSKRVVVVTGAGISCSSGIPDFRSSDGLYNLVKERYPNVVLKGRDLFSASLFREPESTKLFYAFIAELKAKIDQADPGPTHRFIKKLDEKGKLLRSYTQNIDGFEERAGLQGPVALKGKAKKFNAKDTKNVQLHGDIHGVRCVICSASRPCSQDYLEAFLDGTPPDCPECSARSDARLARNARPLAVGTLRPAIVLYDEAHPLGEEIGAICGSDISRKPDVLVIMGTSLKVHGIKRLVKDFANAVHQTQSASKDETDTPATISNTNSSSSSIKRPSTNLLTTKNPRLVIFVNRTAPPSDLASVIDYWVEGDTDSWVEKCESDWRAWRPDDWNVQTKLGVLNGSAGMPLGEEVNMFPVVKSGKSALAGKSKNKGKLPQHFTKSPGSENALPSHHTLSIVRPQPSKPKITIPGLPPVRPSAPRPSQARPLQPSSSLTHAASIPLPSSPKRQRIAPPPVPSVSRPTAHTSSLGSFKLELSSLRIPPPMSQPQRSTDVHNSHNTSMTFVNQTQSEHQRSPKRKRTEDSYASSSYPRAKFFDEYDGEVPLSRYAGSSKGKAVKEKDLGLMIGIDDNDDEDEGPLFDGLVPSSQETLFSYNSPTSSQSSGLSTPPPRKTYRRDEYDMSIDVIDLTGDSDEEDINEMVKLSQETVVAAAPVPSLKSKSKGKEKKKTVTVASQESRRVSSRAKKAPPGGVVKVKKTAKGRQALTA